MWVQRLIEWVEPFLRLLGPVIKPFGLLALLSIVFSLICGRCLWQLERCHVRRGFSAFTRCQKRHVGEGSVEVGR